MTKFVKSINQLFLGLSLFSFYSLDAQWTAPDTMSAFNQLVSNGIDNSGNITAVWSEWDATTPHIYTNNFQQGSIFWGKVSTIYTAPEGSTIDLVKLSVDRASNCSILWQETNGPNNIKVKTSTKVFNNGWKEPKIMAWSTKELKAQIASNSIGFTAAVWSADDVVQVSTMVPAGEWSTPFNLDTNATNPQVSVDMNGNVLVVWEKEHAIYSAYMKPESQWYSSTNNQWSTPTKLSKTKARNPQLAMNSAGYAAVAWQFSNDAYIPAKNSRVFVALGQLGEKFADPVVLYRAAPNTQQDIDALQVAVASNKNALVTWEQVNLEQSSPYQTLSLKTLEYSYLKSGQQWSEVKKVSANELGMYNSKIAFDGAGTAFAVWNNYTSVRAARMPSNGEWSEPSDLSFGTYGLLTKPALSVLPSGFAAVNWTSEHGFIQGVRWYPDPQ